MYAGDRSRKQSLVDLDFVFRQRWITSVKIAKVMNWSIRSYMSAQRRQHMNGTEQAVCRTGKPLRQDSRSVIELHSTEGQMDHLIGEINRVTERGERTLVTTLTKKMAESLTNYWRFRD